MDAHPKRRIIAVLLPDLYCELSLERPPSLLGVVRSSDEGLGEVLLAVSDAARRCGLRPGQRVAEARAMASSLVIRGVTDRSVHEALGRIADVCLAFAPLVATSIGGPHLALDCVFIDAASTSHLFGGEEAMIAEIAMRIQTLGHRVRVAVSDGPVLARAVALSSATETIVPAGEAKRRVEGLSLGVLPLGPDIVTWLARLGIWTIGELSRIPRRAAVSRLGPWADLVLDLAHGRDDCPLEPHRPAASPTEETHWDEPLDHIEPLLFALRRLTAGLAARLEGRGEATHALCLSAPYDAAIARLRSVSEPALAFALALPSPLSREPDLFRVLKSKLDRTTLAAPVTSVSIRATELVPAPVVQLELGGEITQGSDPRRLPLLLAELSAQVGPERIGLLEVAPVHRPEGRDVLREIDDRVLAEHDGAPGEPEACPLPSRLLPEPALVSVRLVRGATIAIGRQLFTIRRLYHPVRFDQVDWWTSRPLSRDYVSVSLASGRRTIEAWMFTDRVTGQTYLHGYDD
jgi:protein ImuB